MRNAWMKVDSISDGEMMAYDIRRLSATQNKFPNVKFKLGKKVRQTSIPGSKPETSVIALLPTPHPNETGREIYEFIRHWRG